MIIIVAKTINLVAHILQSAFSIASFVGQLIVTLFTTLVTSALSIVTSIAIFFQIIYEDNAFLIKEELPIFGKQLFGAIVQQWNNIQHSVFQIYTDCYSSISETVWTLQWAARAAVTVLAEVLFMLKKSLVFAGDTLWLILTFIPIQLPLLLRHLINVLRDIVVHFVVDSYLKLLKLTNFLSDVPLQSLIGILSAILIIRLCVHFREFMETIATQVYWSVSRKLFYLYHVIYNYMTDSEVRAITRLAAGQELAVPGASEPHEEAGDPAEALCVVCQERQKCVLILPCRHVCLCRECCMRLYGYQRTCPICRTFIYHSVTIYL